MKTNPSLIALIRILRQSITMHHRSATPQKSEHVAFIEIEKKKVVDEDIIRRDTLGDMSDGATVKSGYTVNWRLGWGLSLWLGLGTTVSVVYTSSLSREMNVPTHNT